ncbi:MAG: hypothetical protein RSG07_04440 [Erysipelotrichaceae bacterium]
MRLKKICQENNCIAFFISGSGSTLMAISKDKNFNNLITPSLSKLDNNWKVYNLDVDYDGACKW